MKRKVMALLLATALLATTACGGSGANSEKTTSTESVEKTEDTESSAAVSEEAEDNRTAPCGKYHTTHLCRSVRAKELRLFYKRFF